MRKFEAERIRFQNEMGEPCCAIVEPSPDRAHDFRVSFSAGDGNIGQWDLSTVEFDRLATAIAKVKAKL